MDWIELVSMNSKTVNGAKHLDLKQMLNKLINTLIVKPYDMQFAPADTQAKKLQKRDEL